MSTALAGLEVVLHVAIELAAVLVKLLQDSGKVGLLLLFLVKGFRVLVSMLLVSGVGRLLVLQCLIGGSEDDCVFRHVVDVHCMVEDAIDGE